MAKFIELIDVNNRNTLINVEHITSVVIYTDPQEIVRVYLNGDNESFITIKESYNELKEMLKAVTEVNAG
ncbi:hypothetical protein [Mucilaginibacter sp.]